MPRETEGGPAAPSTADGDGPPALRQQQLITRQTLADSVYKELRGAITRGELRDGTELKQAELAVRFGVSRVPVREALRRLQAERLVLANPFQRFMVTSLSTDQVMELLDLREELEVFAVERTLRSESLADRLEAAKRVAGQLRVDDGAEEWLEADREFHRVINGTTTAVAAVIEDVRERVHRYLHSAVSNVNRRREVLREHKALIAALESGDETRVETVVRKHVRGTRRLMERHLADAGLGGLNGR